MQASTTVKKIASVVQDVPILLDEATATSELCYFGEQGEGYRRVSMRLKALGSIQRKRKRFEDKDGVILPANYEDQCKQVTRAIDAISDAYNEADRQVMELLEVLDEAIVNEKKRLKSETDAEQKED